MLFLDGSLINSGVPARIVAEATAWIVANHAEVVAAWTAMGNPEKR